MTSKLVVNTIEADTGISSVSFASSISLSSTSIFHISNAGINIGADTNINRPSAGVIGFNINGSEAARINANGFSGDGSQLTGLPAGLGTALSTVQTSPLNKLYYTDRILSIGSTVTVDHPASATGAYTQYADILVEDNADLIVADGDDLIPDILGLGGNGTTGAGGAGRLLVDNIVNRSGTGAPTLPNGAVVTGVCTATSFSGSGANLTNLPSTSAYTEYSTQTVGGTNSYAITITGDPKIIEVSLFEVRHGSSANIMYRLSNSGGETSSGYYDISSYFRHDHGSNGTSRGINQGQGCLVNYAFNGVNNLMTGKAIFTRVGTGLYTFTGAYNMRFHADQSSNDQYRVASDGHVNNTSAVTQFRIFTSNGANFTSGSISVRGIV